MKKPKTMAEFVKQLQKYEKKSPKDINELLDVMGNLSASLLAILQSWGIDRDKAIKFMEVTIYQTGVYYDWRTEIEKKNG